MLTGIILIVLGQRAGLYPQKVPSCLTRSLPTSPSSSDKGWGSISPSSSWLSSSTSSLSLSFSFSLSFSLSSSPWPRLGSWMAVTFFPHADWRPARSSQPTASSSPPERPAPPGLMVSALTAAQGAVAVACSRREVRRRKETRFSEPPCRTPATTDASQLVTRAAGRLGSLHLWNPRGTARVAPRKPLPTASGPRRLRSGLSAFRRSGHLVTLPAAGVSSVGEPPAAEPARTIRAHPAFFRKTFVLPTFTSFQTRLPHPVTTFTCALVSNSMCRIPNSIRVKMDSSQPY